MQLLDILTLPPSCVMLFPRIDPSLTQLASFLFFSLFFACMISHDSASEQAESRLLHVFTVFREVRGEESQRGCRGVGFSISAAAENLHDSWD